MSDKVHLLDGGGFLPVSHLADVMLSQMSLGAVEDREHVKGMEDGMLQMEGAWAESAIDGAWAEASMASMDAAWRNTVLESAWDGGQEMEEVWCEEPPVAVEESKAAFVVAAPPDLADEETKEVEKTCNDILNVLRSHPKLSKSGFASFVSDVATGSAVIRENTVVRASESANDDARELPISEEAFEALYGGE